MKLPLITLTAWLFLLPASAWAKEKPTVRFAIGEWKPYTSPTKGKGLLEELVSEIFASQGYLVEFSYYPWARSVKLVQSGEFDATFPWYYDEQRASILMYAAKPLLKADTVLFYHKDKPLFWQTMSDLEGYTLGSITGYSINRQLEESGVNVVMANKQADNFFKLYRQRLDGVPAEKYVGLRLIQALPEKGQKNITFTEKPLLSQPMYMLFNQSENGTQLMEIYNKGIEALIVSGCYSKVMLQADCAMNPTPP